MTAQPISNPFANESPSEAAQFRNWADQFNVDAALLTDPENAAPVRDWLINMACQFPVGTPSPDLYSAYVPVAELAPPFPTRHLTTVAAAAVGPQILPVVRPLTGTPWEVRFIMVHADVFRNYTTAKAVAVVRLRRLIMTFKDAEGTREGLFINPEREAERVGITVATLKRWLKPPTKFDDNGEPINGGDLSAEVWLHAEDGVLAYRHPKSDGIEWWECDVRPINIGDDGKIATPADWFVKVPVNWMYQHPDTVGSDYWARTDVSDEAIWAGAVCTAESKGRGGFTKGRDYIGTDWGKSNGSVQLYLNAAEDAGLVTVRNRAGEVSAYRSAHVVPVTTTTTASRIRNQPRPEPIEDPNAAPVVQISVDECPF